MKRTMMLVLAVSVVGSFAARADAPPPPPAPASSVLETDPAYHLLDFWLGDWEVQTNDTHQRDGHDTVERVLQGAAIVERWSDADGSEGRSWFYYQRAEKRWKQVWVTDGGGVKEKEMLAPLANGAVRFRGKATRPDGKQVLDQTTLTPQTGGTVRQVIEVSRDGGATWKSVYDATYRRGAKP
jgi:hypothetical protein